MSSNRLEFYEQQDQVYQLLSDVFGFDAFRDGQEEIVARLLSGQDTLAIMPTGAGKSLCYQLSALMQDGLAIIVSPLIALMADQVAGLKANGVAAEFVNSSQSREEKLDIWARVQDGRVKLLYMSPELLMSDRMLRSISTLPLSMIIVDEAHCVSQWGHDFRPEYFQLNTLKDRFPSAVMGAFTATADEKTRTEIQGLLLKDNARTFVQGFDRPNIRLGVLYKDKANQQMLSFLEKFPNQQGIIYCLSKKSTERTAALLSEKGYKALPYHAGMPFDTRRQNQERFLAEPDVIIVATIAFGMGIDKPDVRFVLHLDLSSNMETYYQEIGRAGRDGAPAEAMMIYGMDNIRTRRLMIDDSPSSDAKKMTEYGRLNELLAFAESAICRRQVLLKYFGDIMPEPCGNCDLCLTPPKVYDGTDHARMIFVTLLDAGRFMGRAHLIAILCGDLTDKISQLDHDKLPSFGKGNTVSKADWNRMILQLVAGGYLTMHLTYATLSMTEKAQAVLGGAETVMLRDVTTEKKRSKSTRAQIAESQAGIDTALYQHLKLVRKELAQVASVPAYVIFSDRTLIDMCARRPNTLDKMLDVHGVGQKKLDKFGDEFLRALIDYQG